MSLVVELASVTDRDDIVADIWSGDELVAEMRVVEARFQLYIYPSRSRAPWSIDLQDWLAALDDARKRLA